MGNKPRNWYRYQFKIGNEIKHGGITQDLADREQQHQVKWPKGHIKQVGPAVTEDSAREWENDKGYS